MCDRQTDGIAVASTELAMRALRRAVIKRCAIANEARDVRLSIICQLRMTKEKDEHSKQDANQGVRFDAGCYTR